MGLSLIQLVRVWMDKGDGYIWESAESACSIQLADKGCRTGPSIRDGMLGQSGFANLGRSLC